MKSLEEIKECRRLIIDQLGIDGGKGHIHIGQWEGSVVWSTGGGWDHVSVRPYKRRIVPSWDDMCVLKAAFFHEDEIVVQYHPARSDYVNNVENCLHLWRYQGEMPTPPTWMVGARDGEKMQDVYQQGIKELEGKA